MNAVQSSQIPAVRPARGPGVLFVSNHRRDEILCEAIAQRTQVVLTLRVGEFWRTMKSRLLDGDAGRRVVIEQPTVESRGGPLELTGGEELGVTFRRGNKKCMFVAVVQQVVARWGAAAGPLSGASGSPAEQGIAAVVVRWPEQLHEMQRRVYVRVPSPADQPVTVRFWSGGAANRPPGSLPESMRESAGTSGAMAAYAGAGELSDLSAGGIALTVPVAPNLELGDPIGCSFTPRTGEEPFVLDAVLRHIGRDAEDRPTLGLQFVGLETSPIGQATLARLARVVTAFQRVESRRNEARWRHSRPAS